MGCRAEPGRRPRGVQSDTGMKTRRETEKKPKKHKKKTRGSRPTSPSAATEALRATDGWKNSRFCGSRVTLRFVAVFAFVHVMRSKITLLRRCAATQFQNTKKKQTKKAKRQTKQTKAKQTRAKQTKQTKTTTKPHARLDLLPASKYLHTRYGSMNSIVSSLILSLPSRPKRWMFFRNAGSLSMPTACGLNDVPKKGT